jgi:hypothetical protein
VLCGPQHTCPHTCVRQVHAANDAVFEDIAAGFSQLCRSLLPSLELQLVQTGAQAHEGLQFRCVCVHVAAGGRGAATAKADRAAATRCVTTRAGSGGCMRRQQQARTQQQQQRRRQQAPWARGS